MHKRKLPIGIQSLAEIILGGYYYVDKTPYVAQLIDQGKYYFLSRPRRFGKSLLLDTIKELFEGNRKLFSGLFIEDKWNWDKKNPVIRISFGSGTVKNRQGLDNRILSLLKANAEYLQITLDASDDIPGQFNQLISKARDKYQAQVVLLVDEYDKPILDNIDDKQIAVDMREGLKNIYTVIKDADPHIKFCLLTGVSKFSKVSLFSGLNNLNDITLDARYSSICGYTDQDLSIIFKPELIGLDRNQIRQWYNGYNWNGESVYNPFDALLLFDKREFKPYWFETATPTFLIKLLSRYDFFTPDLSQLKTDSQLLGEFDVEYIGVEALLFQTGYLTVERTEKRFDEKLFYWLTYPNHEVRISLNEALIRAFGVDAKTALHTGSGIIKALELNNFEQLLTQLKSLYASIPHDWYRKNPISNYEGHYASIFYSHFSALGLHLVVEDANSSGKVDMMIEFNNTIFIFEFKVVEDQPTGAALQQIKEKHYAEKYQGKQFPIYLIGVEFSKMQKQIIAFETELYRGGAQLG
jgi:hypothetical protein